MSCTKPELLCGKPKKIGQRRVAQDFSDIDLPHYLRKLIAEKNAAKKEYENTKDERKYTEFRMMNKAAVAELRSLREKREKDPRRLLPAPDQLSEIITQSISDCVKNRMRFQVTRSKTFRKRFEGRHEAVKKLLKAHQIKMMDSESISNEKYFLHLFGPD
ncbi:hypothetical protein JTB14_013959 [Gonioctena quinquepunctata]|nr:hypothetical protein JTB14_013959 [Gonioctena quinquepunctata]